MTTLKATGTTSVTYKSMQLTIQTPTGSAVFKNTHTKKGYKALWQYIKYTQNERKPFVVLPTGTHAHDLRDVTSIDHVQYD